MDFEKYSLLKPRPFLRAFARLFDYVFFYIVMSFAFFVSPVIVPDVLHLCFGLLLPMLWVPVEALMLSLFGTTPGKALLGIHIRDKEQNKPTFGIAIKRAQTVCLRGLALGIPFINIACAYFAYRDIKNKGAVWDKELDVYIANRLGKKFVASAIALGIVSSPFLMEEFRDYIFDSGRPLFKDMVIDGDLASLTDVKWKGFKDPKGGFTIEFPEKPKEDNSELAVPNSSLPLTEVKCSPNKDIHYSVMYTTLPSKWLRYSPSLVLKGSLKYISKHMKTRIVEKSVKKFKNRPALDYVFFDGKLEIAGKLILIGDTLYKVEVKYPYAERANIKESLDKFLSSFNPK
ncbi:MAG: hypothetical protein SP1CHLAM54_07480 [Chlamydiia bacterium]|nr:hypothetical protein [Chlamydiia bacterium]MCH9615654.1 hypothetical protein [Chlamydiia bacterium]MCH9628943.1 hypothetical protein [Chlamydiia bacterium]